jgi:hypothetical protein
MTETQLAALYQLDARTAHRCMVSSLKDGALTLAKDWQANAAWDAAQARKHLGIDDNA